MSKYRCNFYRISSVVVMVFVIAVIYWSMFASSAVDASKNGLTNDRREALKYNHQNNKKFMGQGSNIFQPKDFSNDRFQPKDSKINGDDFGNLLKQNNPKPEDNIKNTEWKATSGEKFKEPVNKIHPNSEGNHLQPDFGEKVNHEKPFSTNLKTILSNSEEKGFNDYKIKESTRNQDGRFSNNHRTDETDKKKSSEFMPKLNKLDNNSNYPLADVGFKPNKLKSESGMNVPGTNFGGSAPQTTSNKHRWIVLTTIQYPTEDVKFLSKLEGWNVVIVGDTKTPSDWSYGNCHFLSIEKQRELGYEAVQHLKTKSYSRKNVGYLYAIQNGAKVIYETDDDNRPLDLLKNFSYEPTVTGLKFLGGSVFNPYRHFGQPTLWPRGYPLGFVGANTTDKYELNVFKTPSVQQGVVNGDPDMDAVFRLTRKRTEEMLNVSFDPQAPPAILPPGVLSPYNSQNTLFLYDALWSLLIPTTVTFRVCDIWRGYWTQRLLWEIGGSLAFYGPNAFQKRNSHSYVDDAKEEDYLYFKTHDLVDLLFSWNCDASKTFFECAVDLAEKMYEGKFWDETDVKLTKAWFNDLRKLGYPEPKRVPFKLLNPKTESSLSTTGASVMYASREMPPPMYYASKYIVDSYWNKVQEVGAFCKPDSLSVSESSLKQPTHPDIVLVVVFKNTDYGVIPKLDMLYGSKFPHIVFCGNSFEKYTLASKDFKRTYTFVEAEVNKYFSYRCISKAMKMNYRVSGFMMINSQTLLNTWMFDTLSSKDKLWFDHSQLLTSLTQSTEKVDVFPAWANSEYGKTAFLKAWNYISQESSKDTQFENSSKKGLQVNLNSNANGKENSLFLGPSDVVYIPSKFISDFVRYIDMFSKFNVLHEIVVPTVISGLDLKTNMLPLNGKYLWQEDDQVNFEKNFNENSAFLHPVRIEYAINSARSKNFFCQRYLPLAIGSRQSSRQL